MCGVCCVNDTCMQCTTSKTCSTKFHLLTYQRYIGTMRASMFSIHRACVNENDRERQSERDWEREWEWVREIQFDRYCGKVRQSTNAKQNTFLFTLKVYSVSISLSSPFHHTAKDLLLWFFIVFFSFVRLRFNKYIVHDILFGIVKCAFQSRHIICKTKITKNWRYNFHEGQTNCSIYVFHLIYIFKSLNPWTKKQNKKPINKYRILKRVRVTHWFNR